MNSSQKVRMSVTLPEDLVKELDLMVIQRGFESRSQCVAELIETQLIEHKSDVVNDVMAGTITIVYDRRKPTCQQKIAEIQYKHVIEVISSQVINLENQQIMEVILVQGPASKLKEISDKLIAIKGVKTGKLNLTTSILPPLHNRK